MQFSYKRKECKKIILFLNILLDRYITASLLFIYLLHYYSIIEYQSCKVGYRLCDKNHYLSHNCLLANLLNCIICTSDSRLHLGDFSHWLKFKVSIYLALFFCQPNALINDRSLTITYKCHAWSRSHISTATQSERTK